MGYLLDFVVKGATFCDEVELPPKPIFVIFQTDGSSETIATNQKNPEKTTSYNFPARIILKLDSLSSAYMYASLCTFDEGIQTTTPIGIAKIKLKSFPIGKPASFSFTLLSPQNNALKVGNITLTAALAAMINPTSSNAFPMGIPINR